MDQKTLKGWEHRLLLFLKYLKEVLFRFNLTKISTFENVKEELGLNLFHNQSMDCLEVAYFNSKLALLHEKRLFHEQNKLRRIFRMGYFFQRAGISALEKLYKVLLNAWKG